MRFLRPVVALASATLAATGFAGIANSAEELQRFAPTPLLAVEDAYPHVSKDGLVVFQSNRAGGSKLFVAALDGSGLRQLTQGASEDGTPKWSSDGKQVTYTSRDS